MLMPVKNTTLSQDVSRFVSSSFDLVLLRIPVYFIYMLASYAWRGYTLNIIYNAPGSP